MDPYYQMALVLNSIKLINTFVGMNEVSLITRNLKAEEQLNYARKEIYAVLSAMEKVVGNDHENGLDENRELLDKITEINPLQRLHFLKSFRKSIANVIDAYGQGSKWR